MRIMKILYRVLPSFFNYQRRWSCCCCCYCSPDEFRGQQYSENYAHITTETFRFSDSDSRPAGKYRIYSRIPEKKASNLITQIKHPLDFGFHSPLDIFTAYDKIEIDRRHNRCHQEPQNHRGSACSNRRGRHRNCQRQALSLLVIADEDSNCLIKNPFFSPADTCAKSQVTLRIHMKAPNLQPHHEAPRMELNQCSPRGAHRF